MTLKIYIYKIYIDISNGKVSNMFGVKWLSRFDYNQVQLCVHAVMSLYTNGKLGLLMCIDVATSMYFIKDIQRWYGENAVFVNCRLQKRIRLCMGK